MVVLGLLFASVAHAGNGDTAAKFFKTGLGGDADTFLGTWGGYALNTVRLVIVGYCIWAIIHLVRKHEWTPLIYGLIGAVIFGFAPILIDYLWSK